MVSWQARMMYQGMRFIYPLLVPRGLSPIQIRNLGKKVFAQPLPQGMTWQVDQIAGVSGEWIQSSDAQADKVLLYLHGGGYITKTPPIHRRLVAEFVQPLQIRGFMMDYRLAPEDPFPAAIEDVVAVYRELLKQGIAPQKIIIAGDSAGGSLTASVLLYLRDHGDPLPAAACLFSGMLDCTLSAPLIPELQKTDPYLRIEDVASWAKHYYADHDPADPLISTVFADLTGFPPLLIYAGEHEILREDSVKLAQNAQKVGVPVTLKIWQGMIHVFLIFGFLPESKHAIQEVTDFMRRHLA